MTKKDDEALLRQAAAYRQEAEGALNRLLEDEIRGAAVPNALVWIGTVAGALALNLLLLVLVTGG